MAELSPNAEMSLAQEAFPMIQDEEKVVSNALVQRFASLDMSQTAEDAYEAAVFAEATADMHSSSPSSSTFSLSSASSSTSLVTTTSSVSIAPDHQHEFLRLLSRFHQAVTPLPKSISASFARDSDRIQDASGEVRGRSSVPSSSLAVRSRIQYCPTARSYVRPVRRRTESAPGPVKALLRTPVVFNDMESLFKKADAMVDVMRSDMEETMKRRRRKDREGREQRGNGSSMNVDDVDDEAPLIRKVPVAVRPAWYNPSGMSSVQDSSLSPSQHRPIITPRRLRSTLATIPEVTEPGEPLAPDAIDRCASKMQTLKIEEVAPVVSRPPAPNPIRLYVGYNRISRPPFIFGSDMISTPNNFEVAM